jgi:Flp pilus assembly protein TadG
LEAAHFFLRTALNATRRFIKKPDGESGAALVEFTLLGPILILSAVYVMDFGLIFFTKMEVRNAAMAGAQTAIISNSYDSATITTAAQRATRFTTVSVAPSQFCGCPTSAGVTYCAADCSSCATGTCSLSTQGLYVSVAVSPTTAYTPLIPVGIFAGSGSINLSATSTVRIR